VSFTAEAGRGDAASSRVLIDQKIAGHPELRDTPSPGLPAGAGCAGLSQRVPEGEAYRHAPSPSLGEGWGEGVALCRAASWLRVAIAAPWCSSSSSSKARYADESTKTRRSRRMGKGSHALFRLRWSSQRLWLSCRQRRPEFMITAPYVAAAMPDRAILKAVCDRIEMKR